MVTTRTQELLKKDVAHFFHQFGVIGQTPKMIWERGKGAQIWDTNGKQYTDMTSGAAHCAGLGFARKELSNAAYEQTQKLTTLMISAVMSNIPAIEYAAELAEALPSDINHVYFTNDGTGSNEAAVQMARLYWEANGQADKYKLMCLANAYHGSSALTRSLSARSMAGFGHEYPGIVRIPNYHCHQCLFGLKYPSCNIACAKFIEIAIEQEGKETIAAFIAEPVQGGGIIWPPDEYWPTVSKICSDHNILLIADCVQTGFCRTGKFWGMENWNVVPDIMSMGKGINSAYVPFGAVGVSDKVYKDLVGKSFMGGATTNGNPVCVATARAALKIYTEEKLAERSAKLGEHLHERLVKEFLPLPCVDNVMGRGLFQSFEIALNKTTGSKFNPEAVTKAKDRVCNQCLARGVFASRPLGYHPAAQQSIAPPFVMRQSIAPPFVITEDELDAALDVMLSVMKEVKPV